MRLIIPRRKTLFHERIVKRSSGLTSRLSVTSRASLSLLRKKKWMNYRNIYIKFGSTVLNLHFAVMLSIMYVVEILFISHQSHSKECNNGVYIRYNTLRIRMYTLH